MLTILPHAKRLSYAEIPSFYLNRGTYIYFEEKNQEGIVYATRNHKIPPHFLRTVLSAINSTLERANWEKYPDNGLLQTSMKKFPKEKFKSIT